jgi:hypothetical protein
LLMKGGPTIYAVSLGCFAVKIQQTLHSIGATVVAVVSCFDNSLLFGKTVITRTWSSHWFQTICTKILSGKWHLHSKY